MTVDSTGDAPTIQTAIDSSVSGDSVLVGPGTYYVDLRINFLDDFTLVSEAGSLATVLDGSAPPKEQVITVTQGDGVRIRGFTIQKGKPGLIGGDRGGGMVVSNARVLIENCEFYDNKNLGGAIAFFDNTNCGGSEITDCLFRDNKSDDGVSGIFTHDNGSILFEDCVFVGHGSSRIIQRDTPLTVRRCVFRDNSAASLATGGGNFENCTAVGNAGGFSGGSFYNCLIAFNGYGVNSCSAPSSCNNVYGNTIDFGSGCSMLGGNQNISQDPLLCDLPGGDYSIASESPCAPAQSGCGLIGAIGVGCVATGVAGPAPAVSQDASWTTVKSLFR